MAAASITAPTEGEHLSVVGDTVVVKVAGSQTGSAFELFEVSGPVESGPPPHSHPWDEHYYVLDGELEVMADDEVTTVRAGTTITIPAGTTHCYRVLDEGTRFLVVTGGARASGFFRDMHDTVPPGVPSPATMPTIIEVAKRNGLSSPLF